MNSEEMEIEEIIAMLDGKCEKGVSRIKVEMSEELPPEEVKEQYHHGRCDVGSPWAKGTVPNFGCD